MGKIQAKDELLDVNEESVVDMKPDDTVLILTEAESPRILRFRRPKEVAQKQTQQTMANSNMEM